LPKFDHKFGKKMDALLKKKKNQEGKKKKVIHRS